jgi:hypothetical protein
MHDFKLFKESLVRWTKKTKGLTDSGYTGIQKIQSTTNLSDRYRNRRKRFGLRFNLIAAIYNADLTVR